MKREATEDAPRVPRVLVPFADGTEEMEVVIIVDVLRRAGCDVVLASPGGLAATCSRGVVISPDADLEDQQVDNFDALVIPGGGPGTERLAASPKMLQLVRSFHAVEKVLGAICAGPLVLQAAGVLQERDFTCHPSVAADLPARLKQRVVVDGHLYTSQGPGTAMAFTLALVAALQGPEVVKNVAAPLILPR